MLFTAHQFNQDPLKFILLKIEKITHFSLLFLTPKPLCLMDAKLIYHENFLPQSIFSVRNYKMLLISKSGSNWATHTLVFTDKKFILFKVYLPSVMSRSHLSSSDPLGGPHRPRSLINSVSVLLHSPSRNCSMCRWLCNVINMAFTKQKIYVNMNI